MISPEFIEPFFTSSCQGKVASRRIQSIFLLTMCFKHSVVERVDIKAINTVIHTLSLHVIFYTCCSDLGKYLSSQTRISAVSIDRYFDHINYYSCHCAHTFLLGPQVYVTSWYYHINTPDPSSNSRRVGKSPAFGHTCRLSCHRSMVYHQFQSRNRLLVRTWTLH